ncbi:MAG: CpsB/CapC family capsule biosynthesis tyrosine phosphatase [Candidatus Marinimicrobia bacterium]|nr:CpsB/CapC family capsule biosynthesis tyrosine phosphatase [Candidatus Neomarinimicrobiota bacterium]
MIDIHNHILPAVDDGAKNKDVALSMLQEAVNQGVKHLVLTPHLYEADIIKTTAEWRSKVQTGSQTLLNLLEAYKIPLEVSIAAEVRYQDMLPIILEELDVLIGGKYLLLEFSFHSVPNNLERIIYDITRKGIIPIIAHPERIKPWQRDPVALEVLINMGCPLQVDIGSFLGTLGPNTEKLANFLLDRDAVHLVGSDSHNMQSRPLYTKPGYRWLTEHYSQEYADLLLKDNPANIISGEPVAVYPVDLTPARLSLTAKVLNMFNLHYS